MPSFWWPWKKDDSSPASFEKALSTLSDNISKSQVKLDSLRQNSRRFGLLWMLYSVFAYILCFAILALVVGWKNWSALEYTAVAGSPLVIYFVKTAITAYYTYRIDTVNSRLEEYHAERARTIEKLKTATKYNSTQQLLEKYGGASPPPSPSGKKPKAQGKPGPRTGQNTAQRTGIVPPPTANIPRNPQVSAPSTPGEPSGVNTLQISPSHPLALTSAETKLSLDGSGPAEFAPNAFTGSPSGQASPHSQGGNWYDRILDAILGEDETMAKNRLALICDHCKVVLGQAPPGVKRLEDVGKWQCGSCGAWNGVEDEGKKIVKQMQQAAKNDQVIESIEKDDPIGMSSGGDGDDERQTENYEFDEEEELPAATVKTKKEKAKPNRKK